MSWKTPNIRGLVERLKKLREATVSANAGAFAVPLGRGVFRNPLGAQDNYDEPEEYPSSYKKPKKRKK